MVAPSITANPGVVTGFSEYEIDKTLTQRIPNITVFYSTDDEKGILESVQKIKQNLPDVIYYEFLNKGHFTEGDLGTKAFPELLEVILK